MEATGGRGEAADREDDVDSVDRRWFCLCAITDCGGALTHISSRLLIERSDDVDERPAAEAAVAAELVRTNSSCRVASDSPNLSQHGVAGELCREQHMT